jgi:hypothetical protein
LIMSCAVVKMLFINRCIIIIIIINKNYELDKTYYSNTLKTDYINGIKICCNIVVVGLVRMNDV